MILLKCIKALYYQEVPLSFLAEAPCMRAHIGCWWFIEPNLSPHSW